MDTLEELIIKISDFPELYIGKPSVERLFAFLGGFLEDRGTVLPSPDSQSKTGDKTGGRFSVLTDESQSD